VPHADFRGTANARQQFYVPAVDRIAGTDLSRMSAAVSLSEKPWAPWDGGDEHRAPFARVIGNLFAGAAGGELMPRPRGHCPGWVARYRRARLGGNPALSPATRFWGYSLFKNALPSTPKGRRGKNLTNPTFLTEPS
jgi:hypothetical protein